MTHLAVVAMETAPREDSVKNGKIIAQELILEDSIGIGSHTLNTHFQVLFIFQNHIKTCIFSLLSNQKLISNKFTNNKWYLKYTEEP